jgi:hypothetical protein
MEPTPTRSMQRTPSHRRHQQRRQEQLRTQKTQAAGGMGAPARARTRAGTPARTTGGPRANQRRELVINRNWWVDPTRRRPCTPMHAAAYAAHACPRARTHNRRTCKECTRLHTAPPQPKACACGRCGGAGARARCEVAHKPPPLRTHVGVGCPQTQQMHTMYATMHTMHAMHARHACRAHHAQLHTQMQNMQDVGSLRGTRDVRRQIVLLGGTPPASRERVHSREKVGIRQ